MSQGPLRLLRQTDDRRQGSVRAQFDQPAHRHLGESRLETAAGSLAQVAEQLRGVAHAGLTAVDRHQTPASIKGQGGFRKRGQRAQGRPHDGLEYAHAGGGASLAQVAVRNLHAGQLSHVGRQCADAAQNVKDQTLHQLRTAQLGSLAARFGTVLAPELYQKRRRQQTLETLDKGADRSSHSSTCARLHPQCNGVLRSKVQVLSDCNYITYRISLQALPLAPIPPTPHQTLSRAGTETPRSAF